jgi:hypothetical protein
MALCRIWLYCQCFRDSFAVYCHWKVNTQWRQLMFMVQIIGTATVECGTEKQSFECSIQFMGRGGDK